MEEGNFDSAKNDSGGGLNAGAAAGITIGFLGLAVLALFAYRKRNSLKMKHETESVRIEKPFSDFEDGRPVTTRAIN